MPVRGRSGMATLGMLGVCDSRREPTVTLGARDPPHLTGLGWLDPNNLVDSFGPYALWGVLFIIFAECGLLLGFFLPGDTLLFSVGLFVNQGTIA